MVSDSLTGPACSLAYKAVATVSVSILLGERFTSAKLVIVFGCALLVALRVTPYSAHDAFNVSHESRSE